MAAVVCVAPARAQFTVHTSYASWAAAVGGIGLDTFDDLDSTAGYLESPARRTAGSFSYVASAPYGLYPGGSRADAWVSNYYVLDRLTFGSFSSGVRGVAGRFFLTNLQGQLGVQGDLAVTVRSGSDSRTETLVGASAPRFLGFTGTGEITSIEIQAIGAVPITNAIFATANDLQFGGAAITPVPEPSSMALMLAGLGTVGWVARRRALGARRT